jgi:hypothetical protein
MLLQTLHTLCYWNYLLFWAYLNQFENVSQLNTYINLIIRLYFRTDLAIRLIIIITNQKIATQSNQY